MIDPKVISLLKVYETGSFTKAAEQLSLTQPAVSRHVRMLEEELGVKLFVRAQNTLHITTEGELVVKYARRMFALSRNLKEEIADKKRQITSLAVGITHTAESNSSANALARYATTHDNMKIKIVTESTDVLCSMLKNYQLDLAIIEGRISDPSLKCFALDTDCLVLAVSPTNRLAKQASVTIEQLKKENLILRSSASSTRNLFVSTLESQDVHIEEFNILMEIDNIATIKDLIRRNFGVSILAKSACMREYRKKKIVLLPIENLSMVREINLVYRKDFEHPASVLTDIARSYQETIAGFSSAGKSGHAAL